MSRRKNVQNYKTQKTPSHTCVSAYFETLKSLALLSLFLLFSLCIMIRAHAAQVTEEDENVTWVEVEESPTVIPHSRWESSLMPYRDRKYDWGWTLGLSMREYHPEFFRSDIDGSTYEEAFAINNSRMAQFDAGVRYNTTLGGIVFQIGYAGAGTKTGAGITERSIQLRQTSFEGKLILDNFWMEPYIAPYVGAGTVSTSSVEKAPGLTEEESALSSSSVFYDFGFLVLLNWLDWDATRRGYFRGNVENCYLDFGLTQILRGSGSADFGTAPMFTAGIRMEFY